MASKDRILRQKEETRNNILDAAYDIVKEEGWNGLSMRKIADRIEYTAPIIYEYFSNKEAILEELTGKGFIKLTKELQIAIDKFDKPEDQLEAMWMTYWDFAFTRYRNVSVDVWCSNELLRTAMFGSRGTLQIIHCR